MRFMEFIALFIYSISLIFIGGVIGFTSGQIKEKIDSQKQIKERVIYESCPDLQEKTE